MSNLDPLGRAPISNWMKAKIDAELSAIPKDKRGAVVVIADEHGATAHFAARLGEGWKVAAGGGWKFDEKRPSGFVGAEWAF